MQHNDRQYGTPAVPYRDTQANIEALTDVVLGAVAYAEDTKLLGTYNGASWDWIGTSSAGAGYAELLMEDGVTFPPVPMTNETGDDWVYNA